MKYYPKWIVKMASDISSQVWDEMMKRLKDVPDTKMSIGCNDISDIVLNKILEYPLPSVPKSEEYNV